MEIAMEQLGMQGGHCRNNGVIEKAEVSTGKQGVINRTDGHRDGCLLMEDNRKYDHESVDG